MVKTVAPRHVEKTKDRRKIAFKMSDTDVSEHQISSDGRQDSSEDDSSDYGMVQLGGMEPYQDEPLAAQVGKHVGFGLRVVASVNDRQAASCERRQICCEPRPAFELRAATLFCD